MNTPLRYALNLKNFKDIKDLMGHLLTALMKTKMFLYKKGFCCRPTDHSHTVEEIFFSTASTEAEIDHMFLFLFLLFYFLITQIRGLGWWCPGFCCQTIFMSLMWFGSWSELWKWRLVFSAVLTKPFKTHHIIESIPELDNYNCSIMTYHSLPHCFYGETCHVP